MDLEITKKEFLKYVGNYDATNFHIKRKIDHSLRVMKISTSIAKSLNLSQEETDLATLIGLLHDIARFEQFTKYNTFNDSISFDHGAYGVEILKKHNFIRKFIETDRYDDIIYVAIRNHNKFKIEDGLNEKELLFSKIIRDADKLDILYQGTCITWQNSPDDVEKMENGKIAEDYLKPFIEKRPVNRIKDLPDAEYHVMHLLTLLGFIFDINFKISYDILKETDYMNQIIDRFNFKDSKTVELIKQIRKIVNNYIYEK